VCVEVAVGSLVNPICFWTRQPRHGSGGIVALGGGEGEGHTCFRAVGKEMEPHRESAAISSYAPVECSRSTSSLLTGRPRYGLDGIGALDGERGGGAIWACMRALLIVVNMYLVCRPRGGEYVL